MANENEGFPMVSVSSSQIAQVGYNVASSKMRVLFNSGGLYEYSDVPQDVYSNIVNGVSPGGVFHSTVKGAYSFERLS